jgi:hypothetical protein
MPLSGHEAFAYLRDLGVWRDKRKAELDSLDAAALASSDADAFSRDMHRVDGAVEGDLRSL